MVKNKKRYHNLKSDKRKYTKSQLRYFEKTIHFWVGKFEKKAITDLLTI